MTLQRTLSAGMTWGCIVACTYIAAVADEPNNSTRQIPADSRTAVVRELFDSAVLTNNVRSVMAQNEKLSSSDGFDMLVEWVLPSETHADFRMTSIAAAWGLDPDVGGGLRSPAMELVQAARDSRRLTELRELISQIREPRELQDRCAQQTLLMLVALAQSDTQSAEQYAIAVNQLIGRDAIPQELRECAVIAGWAVQQNLQLEEIICPMFVDEHQFVKRRARLGGLTSWHKHVSQIAGWPKMQQATQDDQRDGDTPRLKNWFPAIPMNAQEYSLGNFGTHWPSKATSVAGFSGNANSLLVYRWPLLGDFEVTCQLSDFSRDPVQIMYAGRWVSVNPGRTSIRTGNLRSATDREFEPEISQPRGPVRYMMTVKDKTVRIAFNGSELHRFELDESHDPWLAIRCSAPFHGQIENLSVQGTPSVPRSVPLITSEQMDEWVSWQPSHRVGAHDNAAWTLTAGEANEKVLMGKKRTDLFGSNAESLINHYRPIVQAGTIRYEYFYSPGQSLVHPALGQRAMLIRPGEILFRDIMAASYEQALPTGYDPLNDGVSAGRFSAEVLKQDDWNTVELIVKKKMFRLSINGVDVCKGEVPRHNARTFGLFHFADRTEARVRNIEWTGDWSDTVPDSSEQQLTDQTIAQLDKTAESLTAVFEHDFVNNGLDRNYFSTKGYHGYSIQESELGIQAMCDTPTGRFGAGRVVPSFEITGDFDIVAEFSDFDVVGKRVGSARIEIQYDETKKVLERFLGVDRQRGFRTSSKESNRSLPQVSTVSDTTSGRIRIARRGQTFFFAFAEAGSSRFYLLGTETGTDQPVSADEWSLALAAQGDTNASVVWKNLRLSAESLRYVPSKNGEGLKAIYVVTLPDTKTLIDPNVPLWRQYCERRIEEFKLVAVGDDAQPVIRIPKPIVTSRPGQFSKRLVYLWTQSNSRPAAIGGVIIHGTGETDLTELDEFNSLHSSDIFMTDNGTVQWNLQTPGLQWIELPDAPEPASSKEGIFAQAKELANRFSGTVTEHETPVLRRKNALYEYSWSEGDDTRGGILTSFDNDMDPELLLSLEIRDTDDGNVAWHYAGANYSGGLVSLSLDKEVVWEQPRGKFGTKYVHRGWCASQDLNLREAIVSTVQGEIEKVFDLPPDANYMGQPEWAFDQKSLVFHRSGPPSGLAGATMGRLDLSTKKITDIGNGCMPCLSPDGKQLAFNRVGSGVMRARADGTGEEVLDARGWAVGWSPDGHSIVWGNRNNCTLMDLATGKRRVLLTPEQSSQIDYMYHNISWSPNSNSIAFNAVESGTREEILVVTDIDDTKKFRILFRGNIQPDISWHPDSQHVAFAWSESEGIKRLHVIHRSGDEPARLVPGQPKGFRIQDVDWSPDGKKIAFAAIPPATSVIWSKHQRDSISRTMREEN